MLSANGGRFEINQMLFCRSYSTIGCKGMVKSRYSKVMRCSRYCNGGRMHVILNGEPLEEVDCFKYHVSQVAADGGSESDVVHRMN